MENNTCFKENVKAQSSKLYSLFIGGLKSTTNRKTVYNHFKGYGDIVNIKLKYDKDTKRNKGYAFIDFKNKETVDEILKQIQTIDGRAVECKRGGRNTDSRIQANKIDKYNSSLCKIFVHSLKPHQTAEDLQEYFCKYGEVTNAYLIYHPDTKESKGFGYIHFADKESVEKAFYDVVVEGAKEFKFERFKLNSDQELENSENKEIPNNKKKSDSTNENNSRNAGVENQKVTNNKPKKMDQGWLNVNELNQSNAYQPGQQECTTSVEQNF